MSNFFIESPVFNPTAATVWLDLTAEHYDLSPEVIMSQSRLHDVCVARQTFYWVCSRDGINLQNLATSCGRNRTTIMSSMKHNKHLRDAVSERVIYAKKNAVKEWTNASKEITS